MMSRSMTGMMFVISVVADLAFDGLDGGEANRQSWVMIV